jgi:hypothetical protein
MFSGEATDPIDKGAGQHLTYFDWHVITMSFEISKIAGQFYMRSLHIAFKINAYGD